MGQIQRGCFNHRRLCFRALLPCRPGESSLDGPHNPALLARIPDLHRDDYCDARYSILGFTGCGRTEERIAKLLDHEKRVILRSKDGSAVSATLHAEEATSVQDATG